MLPKRKLTFWLKIILSGLFGTMLLVFMAGSIAKINLQARYPAPGELIDLGGYKLHLSCLGTGQPTVVMEAGLGNSSFTWARIQPAAARLTRVCVYDRAGLGWSDISPRPRLSTDMVDELHTLLAKANVAAPYLLVGHSMGGMLALHYTYLYPPQVVGLVLVDAQHPDWAVRTPAALAPVEEQLLTEAQAQLPVIRFLAATGFLAVAPSVIGSDPRLPVETQASDQALNATRASIAETSIAEWIAKTQSLQQVYDLGITTVGEIPVSVLESGKRDHTATPSALSEETLTQLEALDHELQLKFAALSPNSELIVVEDSGHFIQLERPEVVIDAIRRVLDQAK